MGFEEGSSLPQIKSGELRPDRTLNETLRYVHCRVVKTRIGSSLKYRSQERILDQNGVPCSDFLFCDVPLSGV